MTTFKALNWSPNELINEAKMDITSENAKWLFANTPRATYTLPGGIRRQEGIKIASGRAIIAPSTATSAAVEVRFGNFFTSRCEPNITTGVISASQPKIFCTVKGLGVTIPDHRGFRGIVSIEQQEKTKKTVSRGIYISWQAMGY